VKSKVTFGIIGIGNIAQAQHLPNLTRAPHVRLKTICDMREDILRSMQEKYQVPHATTSYKELLADPDIEAVVIATRPESHAQLAIESLQAGKHVYVEKPLAETVDECQAIVNSQREAGRIAAVGFNRRMAPAYRKAKEIISTHGGAWNIYYRISDAFWQWGRNLPPGSRVIHELCHVFDILRYLVGSEVKSVYCVSSRPDDEVITLQFESGCVSTIMSSGYVKYDMPKERIEVITELGGFFVNDFVELQTFGLDDCDRIYCFAGHTHPDKDCEHAYLFEISGERAMLDLRRVCYRNYLLWEELTKHDEYTSEHEAVELFANRVMWFVNYMMDKGWLWAIDHLAQCILSGIPCELAGPEDGLWASRIAEAAMLSRESGKAIKLLT
jgi:predicted dehydrogenase